MFTAHVKAAVDESSSLDAAIQQAAAKTLGHVRGPAQGSRPLPPAVRREVEGLRRSARRLAKGSPEHQRISREIGEVMRRHRANLWKATLVKLASAPAVEDDSWKLLKHLRKASPTARMVGVPDEEVRDTFSTIYSSNRTRRRDWNVSSEPGTVGSRPELDAAFTSEEVTVALSTLASGKAAGLDGIPHEAYKALSHDPEVVSRIAAEATAQLSGEAVPPMEGRLVVIPKKGAPESAADMRPLMMLPTSRKVVEKLVAGRLDRLAEMQGSDGFHPLQGAFRRGLCIERQLVFADVVIADAREQGRPLRMVGLDLVKAFDRIPKEFAAHCAASYLGRLCPKLSDLVARLTLCPFKASVGNQKFAVTNGVPQGGILSPWLFAMAMNDLALRVTGDGGYWVGGKQLGTLLFADDTLLADDNLDSSTSRCRLAKDWTEEWGGEIHPKKTQWLDLNVGPSPGPGGLEGSGLSIDYLGVTLTPKGVEAKVGPEVFADTLKAIRCTIELRGMAPAPALQVLRSIAWAKVAHGSAVTLPCTAALTTKWLAAVRQVLGTYKQVHRAEVQREMGLLYHPVAWLCRAVIRFYGTAHTTERDPMLKRVLLEIVGSPQHPLRQRVEAALRPTGICWSELVEVPTSDLFRKADARLREWSREQLLGEAARLGLTEGEGAPLWREWGDGPRKYLYEEHARYGFMFRRSSFAPADIHTSACYFCGHPAGDWGRHLLRCSAAKAVVPVPTGLANLEQQSLEQALLLEDSTPTARLGTVLEYMRDLYQARCKRRGEAPHAGPKREYTHNPNFFKFGPRAEHGAANPASSGSHRRRRSATGADESGGPPVPTKRRRTAPPSPPPTPPAAEEPHEDAQSRSDILVLLDEPCHECAPSPSALTDLAPLDLQISRKRDRSEVEADAPAAERQASPSGNGEHQTKVAPPGAPTTLVRLPPQAVPNPVATSQTSRVITMREGPWSAQETKELASAVIAHGRNSAKRLSQHVPTRTAAQIKVKMTTADFRRVLHRLSEEIQAPAERGGPSQSPALTQHEAAAEAENMDISPPTPGLASLDEAIPPSLGPKTYRGGRWSADEHARLLEAIRLLGPDASGEELSKYVGTRSRSQCFERLRLKSTMDDVHGSSATSSAPPPCPSGRWSEGELTRLIGAINQLGGSSCHAELAAIAGSRSVAQVAAKVKDLVMTGKLKRVGPTTFALHP